MSLKDEFNQFYIKYNNHAVEAEDPTNYAQCFDLAFAWVDFLGIPRDTIRHLDAFQIFTEPNPDTTNYFSLIPNTPSNVPEVGDLIVWGQTVGQAGHVAICSNIADVNSFISFDQNWDGVQYARSVNHSYNGVIGFLRPIVVVSNQPTNSDSMPAYLTQLFQEQNLDPNNEGEVRAFWQKALDYPGLLDNYHSDEANIQTLKGQIDNLNTTNNQQADMLTTLRKQLLDCQNSPASPNFTPKTALGKFFLSVSQALG